MSELIDNRAYRIRTLKEIIRHLHEGHAPDLVRNRLKELVREAEPTEIAAMEQELIAEGMSVEEIQSMCDLHSQVLRDILTESLTSEIPPGHPLDTFRRENEALTELVRAMRQMARELSHAESGDELPPLLERLREQWNRLMDIEKHYRRKENLLFPYLEKHGITGPSKVMWGKDDEVRDAIKALGEALSVTDADPEQWDVTRELLIEPTLDAVEEMVYKEEKILFPMAQETLTEDEWGEIWSQSPPYGWCLVEPREDYQPPAAVQPERIASIAAEDSVVLPSGNLTLKQLIGIFRTLPVDLTFVDSDDRVRFFSEGPDRIFERSKAILGRKVQHCHPPKSVHIVEQIISDFRKGQQSVAEFWIQLQGRFIHIRYFAVRDERGTYLGTLEVTQDLTPLRQLEGERRLLQYESPPAQVESSSDPFQIVERPKGTSDV